MAPLSSVAGAQSAALEKRKQLAGGSGPSALLKNLKVFGIACFACLGGLLYGYNQGVFSGVLTMPAFKNRKLPYKCILKEGRSLTRAQIWVRRSQSAARVVLTPPGVYTSNSSKVGWLTSILELGAWVGTLYSGFLAEILSRKYAILINVAIFIIGVVVQATAITGSGPSSILGGRFITGW